MKEAPGSDSMSSPTFLLNYVIVQSPFAKSPLKRRTTFVFHFRRKCVMIVHRKLESVIYIGVLI